jgi:hypothetical protein
VLILGGLTYAFLKIRNVFKEFKEFITPPNENTASKLALVSESIAEMFGRALVASLKGFLMGSKSGEVRAANAEIGAGVDASPIGAIVSMLPKSVRASLIKNPQLLDYALNLMNKKGNQSTPGSNHQESTQVKFKL